MVTNIFIVAIIIWVAIVVMITLSAKVQTFLQATLLPPLATSLMLFACYACVNGPEMVRSGDFSFFVPSLIFPEDKVAGACL
jgi:hypothetical protein